MQTQEPVLGNIPAQVVLSVDEWSGGSKIKFFKKYDGPHRVQIMEFANIPVRKVMEKQFEYMSRNLFFISAFGRFLLGQEKAEKVVKAEDVATRTIAKATDSMRKRVEQARELIGQSGNSEEQVHFSKKQTISVPITTPGAKKYAELLRLADEFYTLNYVLWLDGEIDNQNKFKNESDARGEILGVVRGITNQFLFILNLTRENSKTEAAKAGGHDEEKMAEDAVAVIQTEIGSSSMVGSVASHSANADQVAEAA